MVPTRWRERRDEGRGEGRSGTGGERRGGDRGGKGEETGECENVKRSAIVKQRRREEEKRELVFWNHKKRRKLKWKGMKIEKRRGFRWEFEYEGREERRGEERRVEERRGDETKDKRGEEKREEKMKCCDCMKRAKVTGKDFKNRWRDERIVRKDGRVRESEELKGREEKLYYEGGRIERQESEA